MPHENKNTLFYQSGNKLLRRDSFCVYNEETFGDKVKLGEGSFGTVYKMTKISGSVNVDGRSPDEIAVKVFTPTYTFELDCDDELIVSHYRAELKRAKKEARINNMVYGVGAEYNAPSQLIIKEVVFADNEGSRIVKPAPQYIVMPYIQGTALNKFCFETLGEFIKITEAVLSALLSLHNNHKLVHGDIHDENVLIAQSGQDYKAFLVDFSLTLAPGKKLDVGELNLSTKPPEFAEKKLIVTAFNQDYYTAGLLLLKLFRLISSKVIPSFVELIEDIFLGMMSANPHERLDLSQALARIQNLPTQNLPALCASLAALSDRANALKTLKYLAAHGYTATVIQTYEDLDVIKKLFDDTRLVSRELALVLLDSYQAKLLANKDMANQPEKIDRWCFAERLSLGMEKDYKYSLSYVKKSFASLLADDWVMNSGAMNLMAREVDSADQFFKTLKKLPAAMSLVFLNYLESMPASHEFFAKLKLGSFLMGNTDVLSTLFKDLEESYDEQTMQFILVKISQQYINDKGVTIKDFLKHIATYHADNGLHKALLIALNQVYITQRASQPDKLGLFSRGAKIAAAQQVVTKFVSEQRLGKMDLLAPALNQGELGQITEHLRRTL